MVCFFPCLLYFFILPSLVQHTCVHVSVKNRNNYVVINQFLSILRIYPVPQIIADTNFSSKHRNTNRSNIKLLSAIKIVPTGANTRSRGSSFLFACLEHRQRGSLSFLRKIGYRTREHLRLIAACPPLNLSNQIHVSPSDFDSYRVFLSIIVTCWQYICFCFR